MALRHPQRAGLTCGSPPTDRSMPAPGLEVQRRAIRSWCRAGQHRLVALEADEGVSGTLIERAGLAGALALLRAGTARCLVVHRLDRLARDLVLQEQLLGECWRMGASVSSTAAGEDAYLGDDPADPSRRLIRQVMGAVSAYERDMVTLRLATGRRHKAERVATPNGLRYLGIGQIGVSSCPGPRKSVL